MTEIKSTTEIKEAHEQRPDEDTARRLPSARQRERKSQSKPNLLTPGSQTYSSQNCEKPISVAEVTQSAVFCYSTPSKRIQVSAQKYSNQGAVNKCPRDAV